MSKNKAILIITVAVVLVLAALAVFYFFFRGQRPATPSDIVYPVGADIPMGQGGASTTTGVGGGGLGSGGVGGGGGYVNQPQTFEQKLRLISSLPVAGATLFDKNAQTFIRYVERAEGHVYEALASDNKPPYRISNTTIPKIYEAYWVQNGQGVILQYLKGTDIQMFYAALKQGATSTEQALSDGTFLPNNIGALVVSPAQDKVFYLLPREGGVVGVRSNPNGTQKTQLFSSPAAEWLASWQKDRSISLFTKPSSEASGFLYTLNINNSTLERVYGGIRGLTALPNPSGDTQLLSVSSLGGLELKLFDAKTQGLSGVGVTTLPEKCVWSKTDSVVLYCAVPDYIPAGSYPDVWYQGVVSFADSVWKINAKTGATNRILTPQSVANTTMDITNLVLSAKEDYLLFTNKKDLSLWLLKLE